LIIVHYFGALHQRNVVLYRHHGMNTNLINRHTLGFQSNLLLTDGLL
jgi:hypothetical protein